ncbi:hypothetical protein BKA70DRAFT_1226305 [Coprinopsis sp. MPI-PUGE-AT-0042]|nr:hypothetical protein BKA70DRAFT_1226305 [Coprinopsis sp. MPI-PUGE-AT-0042]
MNPESPGMTAILARYEGNIRIAAERGWNNNMNEFIWHTQRDILVQRAYSVILESNMADSGALSDFYLFLVTNGPSGTKRKTSSSYAHTPNIPIDGMPEQFGASKRPSNALAMGAKPFLIAVPLTFV